jgi:uncharacterized protein (TIGR02453 family)
MPKAKQAHLSAKTFQFLFELAHNNERAWFQENKERYERDVRDPLLEFIREFAAPLKKISKHFVADPRPVGGSMFRIHRDVRFSKDKSPYKTHASIHFRHEAGKDVHAPGYYVHFEPGSVFAAMGLWRPEPDQAQKIRAVIAESPKVWKRATAGLELGGEVYTRAPKGYAPDHPLIEDLKRKDFITSVEYSEKITCSASFADRLAKDLKARSPFMAYLTKAIGLPF